MHIIPMAALKVAGSFIMSNMMAVGTAALSGVGAMMGYQGQLNAAGAARQQAYDNALELDRSAGQDRAVAQLERARQKREHTSQQKETRTAMSVSGLHDDPSIIGETAATMTLQEMLTLAQGEQAAKEKNRAAELMRKGGNIDYRAARGAATLEAFDKAKSWGARYAPARAG